VRCICSSVAVLSLRTLKIFLFITVFKHITMLFIKRNQQYTLICTTLLLCVGSYMFRSAEICKSQHIEQRSGTDQCILLVFSNT
jgi:hypothetical protein